MNSFFLHPMRMLLLLIPLSGWAQSGLTPGDPISPINLLSHPMDTGKYLQVSYSSPYGIPSLSKLDIRFNHPLNRGYIIGETGLLGIPGYYQISLGIGYLLKFKPGLAAGLFLNADLLPSFSTFPRKVILGSSLFCSIEPREKIEICIYCNRWTGFWTAAKNLDQNPNLSISIKGGLRKDIDIISGLSYSKGSSPISRTGISIRAGNDHVIAIGFQTGPVGFWTAYKYTRNNLDFLFTIQTGGVFGLEPGTSLRYLLN